MIEVHQGIPVDALKGGISETLFKHFECLGCLVSPARRGDPDDVALSMECANLVGVEEKILSVGLADDL